MFEICFCLIILLFCLINFFFCQRGTLPLLDYPVVLWCTYGHVYWPTIRQHNSLETIG